MLAHIVTPSALPGFVLWLGAALLMGGLVAALAQPRLRWLGAAAALGGAAITVAGWVDVAPRPPAYHLWLASPANHATTGTAVIVQACGTTAAGGPATVPGAGYILSVSVDGRQVAEVPTSDDLVLASPGRHRLTVQILTTQHTQTTPLLSVTRNITVVSAAPSAGVPHC